MAASSPEEHYEKLDVAAKEIISDWNQRRQMLMQSMVSKSIEDSLKDHSSTERTSSSYMRVLVKVFCRSKKVRADKQQQLAELTIWRITEEQLHLMKEGTFVRMKDLGVKCDRGGFLQLSANAATIMESLQKDPTQYQLIQSGYEERRPISLIRITVMSKKLEPSRLAREVDIVACIVKIHQLDDHTSVAYLTDESGFVMKLIRNHGLQNKDPFHIGNVETMSLPTVVAFCNLQVTSFDTIEQCATGTWSISSCKARNLMKLRRDELQSWSNSSIGMEDCRSVLDRIKAGIPICAGPFNRYRVCIGYILGIDECADTKHTGRTTDRDNVNVVVDYGEDIPLTARLPIHLLLTALQLTQNITTNFSIETSFLTATMVNHSTNSLSEYFQNNQILFRFALEMVSCYGNGNELFMPTVTGVSLAATDALSRLYLSGGSQI